MIENLLDSIRSCQCSGRIQIEDYGGHSVGGNNAKGIDQSNWLQASDIVTHVKHEMSLHVNYCKRFGISREELETSEENEGKSTPNIPCKAYHFIQRVQLTLGMTVYLAFQK